MASKNVWTSLERLWVAVGKRHPRTSEASRMPRVARRVIDRVLWQVSHTATPLFVSPLRLLRCFTENWLCSQTPSYLFYNGITVIPWNCCTSCLHIVASYVGKYRKFHIINMKSVKYRMVQNWYAMYVFEKSNRWTKFIWTHVWTWNFRSYKFAMDVYAKYCKFIFL